MDPLRQSEAQKIICETRPTSQINGKAEYQIDYCKNNYIKVSFNAMWRFVIFKKLYVYIRVFHKKRFLFIPGRIATIGFCR